MSPATKVRSGPVHVLVVDDHAIIRRGLRDLLEPQFSPAVIQDATSCKDLLERLAGPAPHLVILDLQLPDGDALDLIPTVRNAWPGTPILVYSMGAEKVLAVQAIDRGAAGFVSKALEEPELILAVTTVLEGGSYLSQEMELYLQQRRDKRSIAQHSDPFLELSERERRVMHELLAGHGVKEIAGRMDLQVTTVATYKARLLDKLGVNNVLDLERLLNAVRARDQA